jgi:hypothetical protein
LENPKAAHTPAVAGVCVGLAREDHQQPISELGVYDPYLYSLFNTESSNGVFGLNCQVFERMGYKWGPFWV